jgi:hypothetical protein
MISRFSSRCSICSLAVSVGTECRYDSEAKTVQHWECFENPKPTPEQYALADRLGFIKYDSSMASDGILLRMSPRDRGTPARRMESETRRGQDALLFNEKQ